MFIRFVMTVAFMLVFVVSGMAVLAFLLARGFGGDGQVGTLVWLGGCSLSLAFPALAAWFASRAYRGVARPLGEVMEAVDRVAGGDFDFQVSEDGPRDIRKLATSFNRMTSELARADQQRRNLTADVAHELRTPLHILQGNMEGILDGVYDADASQIQAMLDETRLLSRLVQDLQTLSLAESGELPMQFEAVEIHELLEDLKTSFSGPAEQAGVDLLISSPTDLIVQADPSRLDQVLGNLVANALRYTESGGTIQVGAAAGPESTIDITVKDSGEGISEESLPFIFDRFWKGDRARTRGEGAGSGLGLAIVSQLVKAHAGSISVESELEQGTAFHISIPRELSSSRNNLN
jgi:two-component system OmpR family sensor kinase/two-component system sensor histidine kinase BaeS